ncbi:MAG: replicative DNA helicase [Deltaproteobacteria bacterium]
MSENVVGGLRVPPQSIEAEEAVLGGILLDNQALERAGDILAEEDFYRESHRRIWRSLVELDQRREPADVITVTECLKRRGDLDAVGGAAAIAELVERTATAANVMLYARIVKEKAILRGLVDVASDVVGRAMSGNTGDVEQFLDEAENAVYRISERRVRAGFSKVEQIIVGSIERIQQLYERRELVTGVPTGFYELNKLTAGLQGGDLIIIAGRPSMGKSALATNIGQKAAEAGYPVALFSLEMSKESLVLRMLCGEARVDGQKVRTGHLGDREMPRLAMAAARLAELPFYIDDTPALSVMEVRSRSRRLMRDVGQRGLIIVDYLQLMRANRDVDSREQEISMISRSLKGLAKELDVPVVALSQLNRQVESRADKRPMLSDLRESGAIEQDADLIAFVYRDEFYNKASTEEGVAEIIIAKQRNGPLGTAKLLFRKEYTLFENLSEREEEPVGEERNAFEM